MAQGFSPRLLIVPAVLCLFGATAQAGPRCGDEARFDRGARSYRQSRSRDIKVGLAPGQEAPAPARPSTARPDLSATSTPRVSSPAPTPAREARRCGPDTADEQPSPESRDRCREPDGELLAGAPAPARPARSSRWSLRAG